MGDILDVISTIPPHLKDHLSLERTSLANERTLLAYIRTAMTIALTGIGFVKFIGTAIFITIGWGLIISSLLFLIIGARRFWKGQKVLEKVEERKTQEENHTPPQANTISTSQKNSSLTSL